MEPFDEKTQTWLFAVSSLAVAAAVILITFIYTAGGNSITDILPDCVFYEKFHLYCPGCGGTHAVLCLLHGDIVGSFFYHPFVLYAAAVYSIFFFSNILFGLSVVRRRYALRPAHFIAAIVIILLQCLVKNVWLLLTCR